MPSFVYTVKDKHGKTISGKMTQANSGEVARKLKEMGYVIINIYEEAASLVSMDLGEKFGRVKLKEKVNFYIKLVSMLKAGVPLAASLENVKDQIGNKKFRKILDDVHRNILAGNSLSQSLALYPKVFPELLINVVQSGEASGKLIEVLEQYAVFAENQAALRQQIISALTYPCILIIASIGLMAVFLVYLLPKFVDMFKKTNIALPAPTRLMVAAGDFFGAHVILIITILFLLIAGFVVLGRIKWGRALLDKIKLKLPYMGKLVVKVSIARFTRTLGTLYTSGVPLIKSLEICQKSTGNVIFAGAIDAIKEAVAKGKSLAVTMEADPLFPRDMTQMIAIGERSGNLSDMLYKVAEFYQKDVDYAVKNMSTLMEPIVLLMVGTVIGFLAYSVIMPIFNMMQGM